MTAQGEINENKRRAQELADKVYEQLQQHGSGMLTAPQTAQMMMPAVQLAGVYAQLAQIEFIAAVGGSIGNNDGTKG